MSYSDLIKKCHLFGDTVFTNKHLVVLKVDVLIGRLMILLMLSCICVEHSVFCEFYVEIWYPVPLGNFLSHRDLLLSVLNF